MHFLINPCTSELVVSIFQSFIQMMKNNIIYEKIDISQIELFDEYLPQDLSQILVVF